MRGSIAAGVLVIAAGCAPAGAAVDCPSRHGGSDRRETQRAPDDLSVADRTAIRALDARFVRGWLDDDVEAVLAVYSPQAVLMPPGAAPLHGLAAIRGFWWPQDGSHTRIVRFERSIDEIDGTRRLAFLRGTSSLRWTYEKDGTTTTQATRSTDLFLLTRNDAGEWRVLRQIWNALPD